MPATASNFEDLWNTYSNTTGTDIPPAFVFINTYIKDAARSSIIDQLKNKSMEHFNTHSNTLLKDSDVWKFLQNILLENELSTPDATFVEAKEPYELPNTVSRPFNMVLQTYVDIGLNIDPILDYFFDVNTDRATARDRWFDKLRKFYEDNKFIPDFKTRLDYAKEVLKTSAAATVPVTVPGASGTAAASGTKVSRTDPVLASTAKAPILHGPVPKDPELKKPEYPAHKYNSNISDQLFGFKNIFTVLYDETISDSSNEYLVASLVYFYIIQSVEDTIILSMLIFNYGSEYSQDFLYGKSEIKEYDLSFFIDGRENYATIEKEKNTHVDEAILKTIEATPTDPMITIIIKLYIVRYYRVAILNKICKNTQAFTQAIKQDMTRIIKDPTTIGTIESIVSSINSNTASSTSNATQLYEEILGISNIDGRNNIIKYSYIMYYKALINFAVSISLKEPILIEAIIDQVTSDTSLNKKIKELLIKHTSKFGDLYNLLLQEMSEPITYSIFTGLHSSKLFKETKISTSEECSAYIPTMGKYKDTYDLFVKYNTTKNSAALQAALGFTKSTSTSTASSASRLSTASSASRLSTASGASRPPSASGALEPGPARGAFGRSSSVNTSVQGSSLEPPHEPALARGRGSVQRLDLGASSHSPPPSPPVSADTTPRSVVGTNKSPSVSDNLHTKKDQQTGQRQTFKHTQPGLVPGTRRRRG